MTTLALSSLPVIGSINELGQRYRTWLVDIWGVMHDGERAYDPAVEATRAFRAEGGLVVLLSNSPRPSPGVQRQLTDLGVPPDAYDATVTSGDLTRYELDKQPGARVFHLGPERDWPIFADLDVVLVDENAAELVVCYRPVRRRDRDAGALCRAVERLAARQLPMLCANPDHRVERGTASSIARARSRPSMKGLAARVVYAGKPYTPIYDLALQTVGDWLAES